MSKIFIYGVPGAGKTSTSRHLKLRLNYPLVEGDHIKEHILPLTKTEAEDPYLYTGTKQAWRHFGVLNKTNIIKGLEAVRLSAKTIIDNEITLYDNLILEGIFLDPAYSQQGKMFLIITEDEAQHRQQFFQNRPRTQANEDGFVGGRLLQHHLIAEAQTYNIEIIPNRLGPQQLARQLSLIITQ
jgi:2-phosphoglycerate kinase